MSYMSERGPDKKATDLEIVQALQQQIKSHNAPVATTIQICERVDIGLQQTRDRLAQLDDKKVIGSLRVGSGKVWWVGLRDVSPEAID